MKVAGFFSWLSHLSALPHALVIVLLALLGLIALGALFGLPDSWENWWNGWWDRKKPPGAIGRRGPFILELLFFGLCKACLLALLALPALFYRGALGWPIGQAIATGCTLTIGYIVWTSPPLCITSTSTFLSGQTEDGEVRAMQWISQDRLSSSDYLTFSVTWWFGEPPMQKHRLQYDLSAAIMKYTVGEGSEEAITCWNHVSDEAVHAVANADGNIIDLEKYGAVRVPEPSNDTVSA